MSAKDQTATADTGQNPGVWARRMNLNNALVEGRAFIGLIVVVAIFSMLSANFYDPDNLIVMTRHVSMNALLALGMLLVVLNGGIDLSVGSIVGLSGVMVGVLLKGWHVPGTSVTAYPQVWAVVIIAVATGALVGLANGILVTKFNVAPFIATLGMLYVARGFALLMTGGVPITNELFGVEEIGNTGFVKVMASAPLRIPLPVWVMAVFAIAASILLTKTPFGRWLYAMGGNLRAAQLSGVPTQKVEVWIYTLSGLCAGVVGVLLTADLPSATPRSGESYELNAIAAVVIGGAALAGGRGHVRGTIIGAFLVGFLVDGLVIVGVSDFWQQIIKGAVIIFAVALDQVQQKLQDKAALRRGAAASLAARAAAKEGNEAVSKK